MTAAVIALGVIAWLGLAVCFAIAVGLTIRAADEHDKRGRWDW